MIFEEHLEFLSREALDDLQLARFKTQLSYVYNHIDFYRKSFDAAGFNPCDFKSLEDVKKLPFTTKQDLRDAYPNKMFGAKRDDIVRIHASSGTSGQASIVGYTQNDLHTWGRMVARAYALAGLSAQSTIQVSYGYGLFTGGLGAHFGAETLGATAVPMSTGNTKRQIQFLKDFEVDALACTPSYALVIAEHLEEMHIDKDELSLSRAILGGEPYTEEMRREIESALGIDCYDIYGLSEIMGPGVACECSEKHGKHIWEDEFYVEIIDPDTLEVLPDGSWGELVLTTLSRECSPVIRYRTRDISRIIPGVCACKRQHRRLDKLKGRSDDMLVIRGVNVYPSQIESVIQSFEEVSPFYQIVLYKEGPLDQISVELELSEGFALDEIKRIQKVSKRISDALRSNLQINVKVKIVESRSIERSEGKSRRIIDLRGE
ncbi:MAG: phenylacetate--CoA ligase [Coriobacteriia bacterium]|nr:phenylacetate--CoA ligase [Coriobacteriia bacterium]